MDCIATNDMQEALPALASMISRSEKAQEKFAPGTSQHTLLKNRIKALQVASALVSKELAGSVAVDEFSQEDLQNALKPIESLISKSEKAQQKLAPESWQHKMLAQNLQALRIALALMNKEPAKHLQFTSRDEFRRWLEDNCLCSGGMWLLFGKTGGPKTIKANEALEEALCFGWIDGQMQSIDDKSYLKYFARRRESSKWSEKNKAIVEKLEKQGLMTDYGRAKIFNAKQNGQWDAPKQAGITDEQIGLLSDLLKKYEPAYGNFLAMPPSVKKTYTRAYFDAKTDAGRAKRLSWMVDRLNKNLKPM